MLVGILAGLFTGALWGLTFVAAPLAAPFSMWDLTIARYGIFGLTCLVLMLHPRFRLQPDLGAKRILIGMGLGLIGYVGYFLTASQAVLWAGPIIPPLIIGTMPVVLPAIANILDKTMQWRRLALPLLMIALGILVVNVELVTRLDVQGQRMTLAGAGCAVAALLVWVGYGIINANVMRSPNRPSNLDWTNLHGFGAALGSLTLLPLASEHFTTAPSEMQIRFWGIALILGMAASWAATWFWSLASHRLPLALTAQLIVAETLFGLIFGLMLNERWPTPYETIGCSLQIVGVSLAVRAFTRQPAPSPSA